MAVPAAPILASSIWLSHQDNTSLKPSNPSPPPRKRRRLATTIKSINDTLDGGFDFGSISCITSEPGHGPKDLVQELLISHLTSETNATATVVDSTLSFDVRGLFQALQTVSKDKGEALKVLDRLKISKVFDFVGLTEAIDEVRETLESKPVALEDEASKSPPRGTIADSEDEDEDEMLDGPDLEVEAPVTEPGPDSADLPPPARLLIIDNITHVTSPLIKNNYPRGQALLTSLMRSLAHLTRTHDLCTVVLSTALTKSNADDETLSIFKSCAIRPVLGVGLGYLVDVHLYLHQQSSRAAVALDDDGRRNQRVAEKASVLEVVQDKIGGRFGRWGAFVKGGHGRLVDVA
jgi:hypothetical protein